MGDKKHISVSFPSIPFFFTTDPVLAWKNTPSDKITLNLPYEGFYHMLSDKPLFRPGPRPRVASNPTEGTDSGIRAAPNPAPDSKPPETNSEKK
jgi:hypothetical protein